MDLTQYLEIARRRWWVVVLATFAAALAALLFSRAQTPIYKSTMELIIQPGRADFGLQQSAKNLTAAYRSIIFTKRNAATIDADLALDLGAERIYGNTNMGEDAARNAVIIEVKDYDGERANRVAKRWAELFAEFRNKENSKQRREDRVDAVLGDEPTFTQDYPRTRTYVAGAAVLGALLGLLIVVVLELAQANVLRGRAEVQRTLDIPVIGNIPL